MSKENLKYFANGIFYAKLNYCLPVFGNVFGLEKYKMTNSRYTAYTMGDNHKLQVLQNKLNRLQFSTDRIWSSWVLIYFPYLPISPCLDGTFQKFLWLLKEFKGDWGIFRYSILSRSQREKISKSSDFSSFDFLWHLASARKQTCSFIASRRYLWHATFGIIYQQCWLNIS